MAKRNDRKHCNNLVKPGCADLRPAHFYLTRAREAGERTNTHLEASARVPHSAKNAREDKIYASKEQNKLGTSQTMRKIDPGVFCANKDSELLRCSRAFTQITNQYNSVNLENMIRRDFCPIARDTEDLTTLQLRQTDAASF
jgi:hypothetical protein